MSATAEFREPPAPTADEIRRQMCSIREQLPHEADEVIAGARQLVQWRYYVREYPWASLGVAAALGYLAIPRRLEIMRPDPADIAKLAKNNQLVVRQQPETAQRRSMVDTAVAMAGNALLRASVAFVSQQAGKWVGHLAADVPPESQLQHPRQTPTRGAP